MRNPLLIMACVLTVTIGWHKNDEKSSPPTTQRVSTDQMLRVISNTLEKFPSDLGDSNEEKNMFGGSTITVDWDTNVKLIYVQIPNKKPTLSIQVGDITISDIHLDGKNLLITNIDGEEIIVGSFDWFEYYHNQIPDIYEKALAHRAYSP